MYFTRAISLCSLTVALHRWSAELPNHSQRRCVLAELQNVQVVASASSLPLTAKELFKWILASVVAQEDTLVFRDLWDGVEVLHKADE